jgi:ureidoacrylate peracid hydrolase
MLYPTPAMAALTDCMKTRSHAGVAPAQGPEYAYFFNRVDECVPKWQRLQQLCRQAGIEVAYTVIQSLTQDGRDRGLDYKMSGFHVPPGSWDAQVGQLASS